MYAVIEQNVDIEIEVNWLDMVNRHDDGYMDLYDENADDNYDYYEEQATQRKDTEGSVSRGGL